MKTKIDVFVFIGHDYFGPRNKVKRRYRMSIERALKTASKKIQIKLHPLYGDTIPSDVVKILSKNETLPKNLSSEYYWEKIIAFISLAQLVIMDLRPHSNPKDLVNLNVLLELGVAYGIIPRRIILAKNRI